MVSFCGHPLIHSSLEKVSQWQNDNWIINLYGAPAWIHWCWFGLKTTNSKAPLWAQSQSCQHGNCISGQRNKKGYSFCHIKTYSTFTRSWIGWMCCAVKRFSQQILSFFQYLWTGLQEYCNCFIMHALTTETNKKLMKNVIATPVKVLNIVQQFLLLHRTCHHDVNSKPSCLENSRHLMQERLWNFFLNDSTQKKFYELFTSYDHWSRRTQPFMPFPKRESFYDTE